MASFRTLQPGEFSRVLAPLSHAILVDRRKLLALGIPRCSLTGTAWMVLFWKAAAAGWHSFSVGQSRLLREQPDTPMQDTAFLANVLTDKKLRTIGPSEPGLSRGNIGFVPSNRSTGGRTRVLLVSPFLPFPLSHGGAVRIYNLCKSLAARVEFSLIAVREKGEFVDYARLGEVFVDVHVVDIDERPSSDTRLPFQVRQYQSASLSALIADLGRRWRPDLLQVEYTHMASFRQAVPAIPSILVEHDLTFSLYRQLADSRPSPEAEVEYRRWLDFERHWLREYEAVWTVSGDDRQSAIREGSNPDRTFSVPNGVDIDRFQPGGDCAEAPEILYVGSFRHLPNLLGFQKLLSQVMPRVWSSRPNVRLRVVAGPQHEHFGGDSLRALDPRVEVHGFVEDVRPLYARASAVAVPLEVSAGTNIKVLEAMACGKAVVSTPVGCAGLGLENGRDILIHEDWAQFADAICRLTTESELRSGLGRTARTTVEDRFSWGAIANSAWESYCRLLPTHGRRRSRVRECADVSLPLRVRSRSTSQPSGWR